MMGEVTAKRQPEYRLPTPCRHCSILGEHCIDVGDIIRNEADRLCTLPPGAPSGGLEDDTEKGPTRLLERALRKDSALGPVPDVECGPGIFLKHLFEPQLIGRIQRALAVEPGRHQLS